MDERNRALQQVAQRQNKEIDDNRRTIATLRSENAELQLRVQAIHWWGELTAVFTTLIAIAHERRAVDAGGYLERMLQALEHNYNGYDIASRRMGKETATVKALVDDIGEGCKRWIAGQDQGQHFRAMCEKHSSEFSAQIIAEREAIGNLGRQTGPTPLTLHILALEQNTKAHYRCKTDGDTWGRMIRDLERLPAVKQWIDNPPKGPTKGGDVNPLDNQPLDVQAYEELRGKNRKTGGDYLGAMKRRNRGKKAIRNVSDRS